MDIHDKYLDLLLRDTKDDVIKVLNMTDQDLSPYIANKETDKVIILANTVFDKENTNGQVNQLEIMIKKIHYLVIDVRNFITSMLVFTHLIDILDGIVIVNGYNKGNNEYLNEQQRIDWYKENEDYYDILSTDDYLVLRRTNIIFHHSFCTSLHNTLPH